MWKLTVVVVGVPVTWAFVVTSWWALADAREAWRERVEAYAVEHDEGYDAPELSPCRPALVTYLRALTLATGGSAVLAVALAASGAPFQAGVLTWLAISSARSLRTQLQVMRDSAGRRVPTV